MNWWQNGLLILVGIPAIVCCFFFVRQEGNRERAAFEQEVHENSKLFVENVAKEMQGDDKPCYHLVV